MLRTEFSQPVVGDKVWNASNIEPFLFKLGRDPRKDLERSLKQCRISYCTYWGLC